jgi:hypothetical protein
MATAILGLEKEGASEVWLIPGAEAACIGWTASLGRSCVTKDTLAYPIKLDR